MTINCGTGQHSQFVQCLKRFEETIEGGFKKGLLLNKIERGGGESLERRLERHTHPLELMKTNLLFKRFEEKIERGFIKGLLLNKIERGGVESLEEAQKRRTQPLKLMEANLQIRALNLTSTWANCQ